MDARFSRFGSARHARERGAVLLVALIFLILLTLLAIGASSGSLLQQRMVSATRSAQLAQMSANTALRGGEWSLWASAAKVGNSFTCDSGDINATTGCVKYDPSSPLYASGGAVDQFRAGDNKWLSLAGPVTYTGLGGTGYTTRSVPSDDYASPNVAANPQYIIEDMGLEKPPGAGPQHESGATGPNNYGANSGGGAVNIHIYRITARGAGGTKNTVRVAESTFDAQTTN